VKQKQCNLSVITEISKTRIFIASLFSVTIDKGCGLMYNSYLVGIRNRRTNQLIIRPAPLFLVGHHVKSIKALDPASQMLSEYVQARNQLGKAFGTKKAQAAINRVERNKVDVKALAGVSEILQQTIKSKTDILPTESRRLTDDEQNIPRYNQDATSPAEVCPHNYIYIELTRL
jgi:DNA-directed RNA polymerase I subunit RPA49